MTLLVGNVIFGITGVVWIGLLIWSLVAETEGDVARAVAERNASVKQCPDCIKTVPAAARVCSHCQHRFA